MKKSAFIALVSLAATCLTFGCASPDTEEQLNEYGGRIGEAADASNDIGGDSDGGSVAACTATADADITGDYLLGIGAGILGGKAINFRLSVAAAGDAYDLTLQPLGKDACPEQDDCNGADARENVGSSIQISGVELSDAGILSVSTNEVITVAAPANSGPTGGSIVIEGLALELLVCGDEFLCGGRDDSTITMTVTAPLSIPALAAYAGAIKTDDVTKAAFPSAPQGCEEIADFVSAQ